MLGVSSSPKDFFYSSSEGDDTSVPIDLLFLSSEDPLLMQDRKCDHESLVPNPWEYDQFVLFSQPDTIENIIYDDQGQIVWTTAHKLIEKITTVVGTFRVKEACLWVDRLWLG